MEAIICAPHIRFQINDSARIGDARRWAGKVAQSAGLSTDSASKVEIIVNELATNMLKHTKDGGDLLVGTFRHEDQSGIELVAIDRGRGIADVSQMMVDGTSSAGTMGTGLGAIERLSDSFEISSGPGVGTAILSRKMVSSPVRSKHNNPVNASRVGGMSIARTGEEVCGDAWAFYDCETFLVVAVVDGLGHGAAANRAAVEAVNAFTDESHEMPATIVKSMHRRLQGTAGAAVAVARIDRNLKQLRHCGVGNIGCRLITANGTSRGCVSLPGIVGYQMGTLKEFVFDLTERDILMLASDGIKAIAIPSQLNCSATLAAALVVRDFERGNDDITAVVVKT